MKNLTMSGQRARFWSELRRQREHEEHQRRESVIAEFDHDLTAMAAEILRYRHAIVQLADAVRWTWTGAPFIAMGPREQRENDT
jgi:hypothetical protein